VQHLLPNRTSRLGAVSAGTREPRGGLVSVATPDDEAELEEPIRAALEAVTRLLLYVAATRARHRLEPNEAVKSCLAAPPGPAVAARERAA
jgi:hypothetical protein